MVLFVFSRSVSYCTKWTGKVSFKVVRQPNSHLKTGDGCKIYKSIHLTKLLSVLYIFLYVTSLQNDRFLLLCKVFAGT